MKKLSYLEIGVFTDLSSCSVTFITWLLTWLYSFDVLANGEISPISHLIHCFSGNCSCDCYLLKFMTRISELCDTRRSETKCQFLSRKLKLLSTLLSGFAVILPQLFAFLRLEPGKKVPVWVSCLPPRQTSQMNHVQPQAQKAFCGWQSVQWAGNCVPLPVAAVTPAFVHSCILGSEPNNCWEKPDNNHGLLEAEVESGTSAWQPGQIKWGKKPSLSSKVRKQFPQGLIKDEEIKGLPEQMN